MNSSRNDLSKSGNPPADGEYVYEADALEKHYDDGQVQALRGVSFRIAPGEFVAITGQSGCGKTTLLQALGALDKPTRGKLLYRGKSLADLPDPAAYRAHEIGFIFQSFHLLPTLTVLENVQVPMLEGNLSTAARKERAAGLLKSVGLDHRLSHFPAKLSGGERQRVAIARSLANQPSVLLADEPTGNLDSENAARTLELLRSLHREQHMTMILVTHDDGIAHTAEWIIAMRDGRIISDTSNAADTSAAAALTVQEAAR